MLTLLINESNPLDGLFANSTTGGVGTVPDITVADAGQAVSVQSFTRAGGIITDSFVAGDALHIGIGDGVNAPVCYVALSSASPATGTMPINTAGMVALFAATVANQLSLTLAVVRTRGAYTNTIFSAPIVIRRSAINISTAVPTPSILGTGVSAALQVAINTALGFVRLDASARLPAVDGSQLTNLPNTGVTSITGTANEITVTGTTTPTLSLPSALTFTGKTVTGGTFASPTFTTPTIGDGTEAAPSLSFTSDTNTGVYRPAADTVGIVGGGNDVVRLTGIASATDYIEIKNGIGVGSPLHVLAEGASANIGVHLQPKGSGLFTISDGTDFNKGIRFRSSASAASAITLLDAVSTAGRVVTLPDATGTLALVSGDLGTPSALVGTNITGTAASLTAGTVTTIASVVKSNGVTSIFYTPTANTAAARGVALAAAVAASASGDSINIGPGTFDGSFTLPVGVVLRGAGEDFTTVNGTITRANRDTTYNIFDLKTSDGKYPLESVQFIEPTAVAAWGTYFNATHFSYNARYNEVTQAWVRAINGLPCATIGVEQMYNPNDAGTANFELTVDLAPTGSGAPTFARLIAIESAYDLSAAIVSLKASFANNGAYAVFRNATNTAGFEFWPNIATTTPAVAGCPWARLGVVAAEGFSINSGTQVARAEICTILGSGLILGDGTSNHRTYLDATADGTLLVTTNGTTRGTVIANSITLGTASATAGTIGFNNATSGTTTLAPSAGALGTGTVTLPLSGTLLTTDGSGANLTALNASNVSSGTLAAARMANAGVHTGDATGTFPAITLNAAQTGITSVGTLTGGATGAGFTVALSTSTITGTLADARLSANVPLKDAANTFTAENINSKSGAASVTAMKFTGVPFAGTGTTSFPLVYINDANATASTTLNTAGTYLGVNGDGTQDLMNLMKDGVSKMSLSNEGIVAITSSKSVSNSVTQALLYVKNTLATSNGQVGLSLDKGASNATAAFNFLTAGTAQWDCGISDDNNFHVRDAVNAYAKVFNITQGAGANALNIGASGAVTMAGTLAVTGATTLSGGLAVNTTGSITTNQTTFAIANTTATTLNIGGAATTIAMGAAGAGTMNIPLTTSASSATTGALTIGNGTAATNVGIGGGNINAGGTIVAGGNISSQYITLASGRITINSGASTTTRLTNGSTNGWIIVDNQSGVGGAVLLGSGSGNPGIFRSGTTLQVRLADNSADAPISASNVTASGTLAVTGATTLSAALITTPQALSGAGAINLTTAATDFTSTGAANALTLANGTVGQFKFISHAVKGTLGTGVLTPTTCIGFTTITFNNAGDSVTLRYTSAGWAVHGSFGAVIA